MSQIKLLHSGGNGVILSAPDSNPASDRTLKLPGDTNSTVDTLNRAGNILQVIQTYKTDVFSSTPGQYTWVDVTGLSASITTTGSNKVKVTTQVNVSTSQDGYNVYFKVLRGSTDIGLGDALGSMTRTSGNGHWTNSDGVSDYEAVGLTTQILDSPSAGTHTYKIQLQTNYNSQTIYAGRSQQGTGTGFQTCPAGFITLEEVAA